jgi:hypothetical protein
MVFSWSYGDHSQMLVLFYYHKLDKYVPYLVLIYYATSLLRAGVGVPGDASVWAKAETPCPGARLP